VGGVDGVQLDKALAGPALFLRKIEFGESRGVRIGAVVAFGVPEKLFVALNNGLGERPSGIWLRPSSKA
jgi:hypothetical protein